MDIEKLIERLRTDSLYADKATLEIMDLCMEAADAISTLQAENEKLLAELEQVKRCLEIVEHQREAAIDDMTALMAGQCCDLCAVEYCNDRGKTEMCTAFKWRGTKEG